MKTTRQILPTDAEYSQARSALRAPVSHTSGPWTANLEGAHGNHAGGFSVETWIDGEGTVVICGRAGWPSRAVESHANARLIAPDLYAALKAVLAGFDAHAFVRNTAQDHEPTWAIELFPHLKALADATVAIAKAEGADRV
jgi:hypothetical protein